MPDTSVRWSPADQHVHSEWSWDAFAGSMDRTCARAVELGLGSVAFTEHADFSPWHLPPDAQIPDEWLWMVDGDRMTPPALDVDGYLDALESCRERYPGLRILSGVELSEPHWHADAAADVLTRGRFDRVLASLHSGAREPDGARHELSSRYAMQRPVEIQREYLLEAAQMVEHFPGFEVLAHVDYPVRYWPTAIPYDPHDTEAEHRHLLRTLADHGKVLEVNTKVPLRPEVLRWWREEGGERITFASDAHSPDVLAHGFSAATDMAAAHGFVPDRDRLDFWRRT